MLSLWQWVAEPLELIDPPRVSRLSAPLLLLSATLSASSLLAQPAVERRRCPADMVRVQSFCIDRFEMALVDRDSGDFLSPFYPPQARLIDEVVQSWTIERERVGDVRARHVGLPELTAIQSQRRDYVPRAVSFPGIIPQAYVSQPIAKWACESAGKRLCSEREWVTACRGQAGRKFPYGERYEAGRCNVYRFSHPAQLLHGASWYGHRDPRLNLVLEADGSPLLRLTGASEGCASSWGEDKVYDMVGNLDEWVDDPGGVFVGGFYARSTREGCEAKVSSHAVAYYDYSTGARCCQSL